MRAVPGQPGEIANPQDCSASDCGHRHPVQHPILSENQASPPACRLLLWQPKELLQVRELVVGASSRLLNLPHHGQRNERSPQCDRQIFRGTNA
jgi:hypothetical protein